MPHPDDDPLAPFVVPGAVVLVGEVHGSHELPAVVARLAALAGGRGLPVAVAVVAAGGVAILLAGNAHTRIRRRVPFGPPPLGVQLTAR